MAWRECGGEIVNGAPLWALDVTPGQEPDENRESMLRQMHDDAQETKAQQAAWQKLHPGLFG